MQPMHLSSRASARRQVLAPTSPSQKRLSVNTALSPRQQTTPDMDQLRLLAHQQRQKQRRNRVITPHMLKSRPIETKQNIVTRSKHKSSANSVTSEITHRSDITEKVTNNKSRLRRNQAAEFDGLEALESVGTFESMKNDAENKMAMANTMLADVVDARLANQRAEKEIAKEKERMAEERKRYEAAEKQLAAEAEERRKSEAEAAMRIQLLEAEQKRLEERHMTALTEATKASSKETLHKAQTKDVKSHWWARKKHQAIEQKPAGQPDEVRKASEEAAEKIKILEAEQKRLDYEHKAALIEVQRQANIAAEEEKKRREVELLTAQREEELRLEAEGQAAIAQVELRRRLEAEKKRTIVEEEAKQKAKIAAEEEKARLAAEQKAHADALERIKMLEAKQKRLEQEHVEAMEEAKQQAQSAANEDKKRLEAAFNQLIEQHMLQLEEQLRVEAKEQGDIASAEQMKRLEAEEKRLKFEEEAQREAQIAAEEEKKQLEAEVMKFRLEVEAQRQAQIAANEEKSRLEAAFESLRIEAEKQSTIASTEEKIRLAAEEKRLKLQEEAQKQAQIAAAEEKKRLETESRRLQLEEEAQKQAQIAATEEAKRLQAEQVRLELEAQLRLVHEKRDADEELRKWIDIKRLQVGRQAAEAAALRTCKNNQGKNEVFPGTQSCSGFFVSEGVSDCSSEEGEIIPSNSTLKETIEVELPIGQVENDMGGETINDAWLQHDTGKRKPLVESESFDIGKVIVRHEAKRESRSIYSDFIPDASRKAEAQSRSVGLMALFSKKENNTPTEVEEGDNTKSNTDVDVTDASEKASQVEKVTEHFKQEDDGVVVKGKQKKTRPSFRFLRRGKMMTKEAVVSNALDVEETSVARVQRLELELSQLSKEIARTKEEAASLSRRRQLPLGAQRMVERGLMGTLLGKTIKENEGFKETETPSDAVMRDQMEEGIEVMPTLSDAEYISVYTPVTVDESAFEQKPNLLQRTGSLIKRHHLRRNGSFTKMSKKEKELFRRAKAMANADNKYQETFEDEFDSDYAQADTLEVPVADVEESDTMEVPADAIPDPNDCVCEDEDDNQHDSPHVTFSSEKGVTSFTDEGGFMYDEDIADLVPKNTSTSLDYEEEDVNEFVISSNAAQPQTRPPGELIEVREFIEIPEKRIPARGVAFQTDSSPITGQQMISPRSNRPYKDSLFDSIALFGAKACMGTSRAVLSCADTCNDNNPDSRVHEALERTSSHSGGHGYDYNPISPQAPSMFRCGNDTYSKEEEDLVTRSFVNALHRVDTALHTAGEEKSQRGAKKIAKHSAMRSGRHSKRRVNYNDIMSVDGKFVNAKEYKSRRKERVPRNLALKPKVQTPRVMAEIREESKDQQELIEYKEKKSLGNKVLKGFKKLAKARIVYDDA